MSDLSLFIAIWFAAGGFVVAPFVIRGLRRR